MDVRREENFRLNGVDSWVHCLCFDYKRPVHTNYHFHEYIEILFFMEGTGTVWVNGIGSSVAGNTLVIINSQKTHRLDTVGPMRYACIKLMPDILYTDVHFFGELQYAMPFVSEKPFYILENAVLEQLRIVPLLEEIIAEWEQMRYGFEMVIRADLLQVFSKILRYWHSCGMIVDKPDVHPQIVRALAYLRRNLTTVTERDAASFCSLSYPYFSNLFKKCMGKNFKDYLIEVRLAEAEKLLLTTDYSVSQVAMLTGFASSSHFVSRFREKNGTTPMRFRTDAEAIKK